MTPAAALPSDAYTLSITKTFEFAAHHRLPRHNGKCARDHGHNYRLEVTATGPLILDPLRPDDGMVLDFGDLKALVAPLLDVLDHYSLNDTLENPTAEHLALWLLAQLPDCVTRIVVWETSTSFATAQRSAPRSSGAGGDVDLLTAWQRSDALTRARFTAELAAHFAGASASFAVRTQARATSSTLTNTDADASAAATVGVEEDEGASVDAGQ